MTPPSPFEMVLAWQVLDPFHVALPCSAEHVLEFPIALPLWLHVCAGISTRQITCHNVQPTTDTRTSWKGCTIHYLKPFSASSPWLP